MMRLLLAAFVCGLSLPGMKPSRAEVSEVKIAVLPGISYLPLMVMERDRLLEKHAAEAKIDPLKVEWIKLSNAPAANDGLLSGAVHFASGGVPAFLTIWSKTRNNYDVRAVAALCAMPLFLNTKNPSIRSLRDFSEKDRIALPAVKVSAQSIILQMAAEQEFGDGNAFKLDPLTVGLSHPVGMAALLSGQTEINSHFTAPPFQYQELQSPGVRTVLNSYSVLGAASTFTVVYASGKFRSENPKAYAAFTSALDEAFEMIAKDKKAAAEAYLSISRDKSGPEAIVKLLNDPDIAFSATPNGIMKQAAFMGRIGSLKVTPKVWTDLFFENVHNRSGS